MKRAFTLVEMIVVVGIIGILAGILIASLSGGTESARAAKCLSNLKNLAVCWNGGRAGSQEHLAMSIGGMTRVQVVYYEEKGWISYYTKGLYPTWDGDLKKFVSPSHQTYEIVGFLEKDKERVRYAFTNGWMSAAIGQDNSLFVCPTHIMKQRGKETPNWSYFMSAAFGWDACRGEYTYVDQANKGMVDKIALSNAERLLLFAEIPFQGPGDWFPESGSTTDQDAILQYKGCSKADTAAGRKLFDGTENIGCNHRNGKNWFAHVAFADGHVEKLRCDGLSGSSLRELTTWLCQGLSVGRNRDKYEVIE